MKKRLLLFIFFLTICILPFYKYFVFNEIPFNGTYLVSEYSPFKEETRKIFPNGLASKPNFDDQLRQLFPYLEFTRKSFLRNEFPKWNPYQFSGVPFSANWLTAVYFPTTILLFFISVADYWTWTRILPFFISLYLAYAYFKSINLSRISCIWGAVLYTFSGMFITYPQESLYINFIMAFLPGVLYGLENYKNKKNNIYLLLIYILLVISWLAGQIQLSFYLFLFTFIYSLFRFNFKFRDSRLLKIIFIYILSVISVLFFIIPGLLFYMQSSRRFISYTDTIKQYLLPWETVFTFFFPDFLGNPGTRNWFGHSAGAYYENAIWIPSTFLIFFIYEIKYSKKYVQIKKIFLGTFLLTAILVFKNPISYYAVNLNIPILGTAIFNRLIFLNTFAVVVLSTLGFEEITGNIVFWRLKLIIKRITLLIFVTLLFIFIYQNKDFVLHRQVMLRQLLLSVFVIYIPIIFLVIYKRFNFKWILFSIILISFLQSGYLFNKYTPFASRQYFYPSHPLIDFLHNKTERDGGRVFFENKQMQYYWDNLATYYEIPTITGYDSFNYIKYNDMLFYLDYPENIANNRRYDSLIGDLEYNFNNKIKLLRKLQVQYVVSNQGDAVINTNSFTTTFKPIYIHDIFTVWTWKNSL